MLVSVADNVKLDAHLSDIIICVYVLTDSLITVRS